MIPAKYVSWGNAGSTIRELAAYGAARAKVIGAENVFDFTIGSPSVAPPESVLEKLRLLAADPDPVALHAYAPAAGIESVRCKVADYLNRSFGSSYDAGDIYMTHGSSSALALVCAALLSPGDEALALAPYFPEYRIYAEQTGAEFTEVLCDLESFRPDMAALEAKLTEKTALVIINSPNNPSGVVLDEDSVKEIAGLLRAKSAEYGHPIYILADEPYRELVYGGLTVPFIPSFYPDTLYCYSFSKSVSLPGERIGYIAMGKDMTDYADVKAAVCGAGRALGYICVSPMFQLAVADTLGDVSDISVYDDNRSLFYDELRKLGFTCIKPDGAFYLFIKAPDGDSRDFCRRAMEKDLLVVPGDDFGCPGFARIAYCVPMQRIVNSLPAFKALAEEYGL
ncbi:MAG: pyridoxal phosphate-dependent aminotransferase [Oscillospiraceae bacterium]|nr:pyridoxal phosphate-dependent aminotransferase [Oscillospiraceae bacterium]